VTEPGLATALNTSKSEGFIGVILLILTQPAPLYRVHHG